MHFTSSKICQSYLNSKSTGEKNSQNISQCYLKVLNSKVKSTLLHFNTYKSYKKPVRLSKDNGIGKFLHATALMHLQIVKIFATLLHLITHSRK